MKFYSVDLRQKIINVYETEPISQRQLAKRFCVALSFVQKLLKQYRQTQDISPQTHRCGGQLKLTPEQLVILAQLIETNNDATLEELCELLHEKIGVTVSRSTMGRMTQRLNMTFKKKRFFRQPKARSRVQNLRYEFWKQVNNLNVQDLIFIDESGVNLAMVRLYARSLKGSRALLTKTK